MSRGAMVILLAGAIWWVGATALGMDVIAAGTWLLAAVLYGCLSFAISAVCAGLLSARGPWWPVHWTMFLAFPAYVAWEIVCDMREARRERRAA